MRTMTRRSWLPAVAVLAGALAAAQPAAAQDVHLVADGSLTWVEANVPGFAPGMKMAVVHGDPSQAGPYTLRLSFPDGYRFPPHWHPADENVTVLSGTFLLGMGGTVDESAVQAYTAGDYLFLPARNPHFGGAQGETVIQLHGVGPFAIELGAPPSQ